MPFLGKFPTQIVDPEVDINGGAIDGVTIGATTASAATVTTLTSGNITTTGYIAGPATFTIDPAAVGDNTGTLVVAGNLQVDGTTTTINSTTMTVDDLNITLASGAANAAAANGAGITVDGASATLTYNSTPDAWSFNKNVGIGTSSPSETLQVENASNNAILLNAPANRYNSIGFQSAGTDKWWLGRADTDQIAGDAFFIGADNGNATDAGGLSAKLVIDSSGNVGIGTSSPSTKLEVAGNIGFGTGGTFAAGQLYSDSNWGVILRAKQASPVVAEFAFHNAGGTERMRIDAAGNLDMTGGGDILFPWNNTGTYSVGQKARSANFFSTTRSLLELKGADAVGGAQAMAGGDIKLRGGIGAANLGLGVLSGSVLIQGGETTHGLDAGAGEILFYTGGTATERMRIDTSGNVGIGTASPSSKTEIQDKVLSTSNRPTYKGTLCISDYGNASSVSGGLEFHSNSGGGAGYGSLIFPLTDGTLGFATRTNSSSWSERMRIDASGKVAIGYAGPPSALFQVGWNGVATNDAINIGTAYSSNSTKTGIITWRDGANVVGQIDTSYDGNSVRMNIGSLYKAGYNSTDIMRIDPRHVTMPNQPHAQAYLNGNQSISANVWTQVNMNATDSNIGSHYNTSTRRFTAPVAGKYLITYSINFTTTAGTNGYLYSRIDINGALRKYTQGGRLSGTAGYDGDYQLGGSLTVYLNANDYVTLAGYSQAANAYNGSINPARTYCNFTLLG